MKDVERRLRAGNEEVLMYKELKPGTKIIQWQNFLFGSENKSQLINFIVEGW